MAIHTFVCILAIFVQMQFPSTSCINYFSAQGVPRSDGLDTLFGEKYKSDLQSLALAFKSGNEPRHFAEHTTPTDSEDNDDLQSKTYSVDLLETDKDQGQSEIGGYEDSSVTGSRKTNIKDGKAVIKIQERDRDGNNFKVEGIAGHVHERKTEIEGSSPARRPLLNARAIVKSAKKDKSKGLMIREENINDSEAITKMTLHHILSQPEKLESPSADKLHSDAGKTTDMINSNKGNGKRPEDRRMQKRASIEDDKENMTASGSAGYQETVSFDIEASAGKLDDHNQTIFKRLKAVNHSRNEEEFQTKDEQEFSGRDPLTIFLGTSGSGDGQYSGSGMEVLKHLQKQATTPVVNSSTKILGSHKSNDGSALKQTVPPKTHFKPTGQTLKGENESGSGMSVDPVLLLQVRKIRMNVLQAEKQATKELTDVRKDFRLKMEDVEEDLRMVRKLTSNVHKKVGLTINEALVMARQAKSNATNRLHMAQRAATALNNIEKKLGVIHTRNASRILRSRIPKFPNLSDVALYKQLLTTDAILTKLDGAKTLAVSRAEKRFHSEEETGSSIAEEVDSLRDELASAEKELSDETEAEMEDEREAQEKLQEAMQRNKLVTKKTAFALAAVENYLQKLQSDESKLKQLKFY